MAKSKSASQKRPVKARGTIPAPRTAPKRNFVPIHRRRPVQAAAALVTILLIALIVWRVLDARAEDRRKERAIERFDNSVITLFTGINDTVEAMSSDPAQYGAGLLAPDDFRPRTEEWVENIREVNVSLRAREVPSELATAKALSVNAALIYLDAAKSFRLAAKLGEGEARVEAIGHGENLMAHAQSLLGLYQREIGRIKVELGMITPAEAGLDQEIQLPPEEQTFPPDIGQQPGGAPIPVPGEGGDQEPAQEQSPGS